MPPGGELCQRLIPAVTTATVFHDPSDTRYKSELLITAKGGYLRELQSSGAHHVKRIGV